MAALVAGAEREYAAVPADLIALGQRIFRWLDGPTDRWLAGALTTEAPFALQIDSAAGLRGVPWEILAVDGSVLAVRRPAVSLVRRASNRAASASGPVDRAARIAFLAASPLHHEPVLDFEGEEALLLEATEQKAELLVEESGSLEGLHELFGWFPPDHFDVLHLSGHAVATADGARFVMEDVTGARRDVSAEEIADAIEGRWPRLVFLSGCHTSGAREDGAVASMAEALVAAGADAVLGWALPVGDQSASDLAAALYGAIAGGASIPDAVTTARRALHKASSPYWHLLRLHSSRDVPGALVTAPGAQAQVFTPPVRPSTLFFDPAGNTRVADKDSFVGRRRDLQHLLGQIRRPIQNPEAAPVAVIHGLGGLGKSTLTARVLQRLSTYGYRRAVLTGQIDERTLADIPRQLHLKDDQTTAFNTLLGDTKHPVSERLRFCFARTGPLSATRNVLVFDDFEDGNLEPDGTGGHLCRPAALEVLTALAAAIRGSGSATRIIVTSRYDFALPPGISVHRPIGPLAGHELAKKLRLTQHLGPRSTLDPAITDHAVAAAAGIPRLIERIDALLGELPPADIPAALTAIEQVEVEYREDLLLTTLLDASSQQDRRLLAQMTVYDIAVPIDAIRALDPGSDLTPAITHTVGTGLLHAGTHPRTGETRYLVSPLVRPLLAGYAEALTPTEFAAAQERAARALYRLWVTDHDAAQPPPTTSAQ